MLIVVGTFHVPSTVFNQVANRTHADGTAECACYLVLARRTGLRPVWLVALIETPGPKSRPMVDEPSSLKPQASSLFWPSPFRESRGNRVIIVDWWTSYGVPTDIVD
jgi:hypothetical protein